MLPKFVKSVRQKQLHRRQNGDEEREIAPTFSTIREQGVGYESQLKYLQDNVITPFLNRAVYQNSGQAEEKVPQGVTLCGTNKDRISLIARAVANELSLQSGGDYVHFIDAGKILSTISLDLFVSPSEKGLVAVEAAFKKPKGYDTTVIFLQDFHPYASVSTVDLLTQKRAQTQHKTLLICSVKDKIDGEEVLWRDNKVLKYLHIPNFLTAQARLEVLHAFTSKWGYLPDADDLRFVADMTLPPFGEERGTEKDLKTVAKFAYRRAVERLQKSEGLGDTDVIDRTRVHVSLEDWKESLQQLLEGDIPSGSSHGLADSIQTLQDTRKQLEISRKQLEETRKLQEEMTEIKICNEMDFKSVTKPEEVVDKIKSFCTYGNINLLEVRDEWCEDEENIHVTIKIRLPMKKINEEV
ncbi:uncharacterized protein LOC110855510 [Folsomia candida]|uniref:AAA ATPase forming ring-shaped complexes n=1 Tax=Folsomia candida TaxID=158441 RepID=A0A226DS01_FOLCA|nr:uncharacterized protein LOC110855510 [Folsomia candida]OXA47447.1 AAA ATPase forming ring-shaped complexes [Folsomia candida]